MGRGGEGEVRGGEERGGEGRGGKGEGRGGKGRGLCDFAPNLKFLATPLFAYPILYIFITEKW